MLKKVTGRRQPLRASRTYSEREHSALRQQHYSRFTPRRYGTALYCIARSRSPPSPNAPLLLSRPSSYDSVDGARRETSLGQRGDALHWIQPQAPHSSVAGVEVERGAERNLHIRSHKAVQVQVQVQVQVRQWWVSSRELAAARESEA